MLSFLLLITVGKRFGERCGWIATAAIAGAFILGAVAFMQWRGADRAMVEDSLWTIASIGIGEKTWDMNVGVKVDGVTMVMFLMVTFVATWIHVFSIGYMHDDSRFNRFFAYLGLFCFSMLGLVIANNLIMMFIFWELVGVCSYFLIGFWYEKPGPRYASIKAMLVNRIGDALFMLGIFMTLIALGTANLNEAAEKIGAFAGWGSFSGQSYQTWAAICLFFGCVGKSAQFPLHVWLPDAMEGPTPVSALIHAATMVAAGVYLVSRIFFLLTDEARLFISCIGAITLTGAALIAVVMTDIKKVLAYSTVSQLGYMVLGLGMGGFVGGLFHLITHAFFKALLFLGSGSVIHGCHHEQEITKMGGLMKKMPVTGVTFFIAVLAIAGFGFGDFGFSGYYSKDMIIGNAYSTVYGVGLKESGHDQHASMLLASADEEHAAAPAGHHVGQHGWIATFGSWTRMLFWLPVGVAYITAFYMTRVWWLTFMGQPRDRHVHDHAHETKLMWIPLVVLAVFAVCIGWKLLGVRYLIAGADPADTTPLAHGAVMHHVHKVLLHGFAPIISIVVAILIYRKGFNIASLIAKALAPIHTLLVNKFYFDEIYEGILVAFVMIWSRAMRMFDTIIVDGLVNMSAAIVTGWCFMIGDTDRYVVDGTVNGSARAAHSVGNLLRRPQTGNIRNYILAVVLVAAVLLIIIL